MYQPIIFLEPLQVRDHKNDGCFLKNTCEISQKYAAKCYTLITFNRYSFNYQSLPISGENDLKNPIFVNHF